MWADRGLATGQSGAGHGSWLSAGAGAGAGDYDALLRYLASEEVKVTYLREVLVKMRVGGASNGSLKQILRKSREDVAAMRNNGINPLVALP